MINVCTLQWAHNSSDQYCQDDYFCPPIVLRFLERHFERVNNVFQVKKEFGFTPTRQVTSLFRFGSHLHGVVDAHVSHPNAE
jgi:hypothetical protein